MDKQPRCCVRSLLQATCSVVAAMAPARFALQCGAVCDVPASFVRSCATLRDLTAVRDAADEAAAVAPDAAPPALPRVRAETLALLLEAHDASLLCVAADACAAETQAKAGVAPAPEAAVTKDAACEAAVARVLRAHLLTPPAGAHVSDPPEDPKGKAPLRAPREVRLRHMHARARPHVPMLSVHADVT